MTCFAAVEIDWTIVMYVLLVVFAVSAVVVTVLIGESRWKPFQWLWDDPAARKRGEKRRAIVNHPDYEWNKLNDRAKLTRVVNVLNNDKEFIFVAHEFDINIFADHVPQRVAVARDGTRIPISDMSEIIEDITDEKED